MWSSETKKELRGSNTRLVRISGRRIILFVRKVSWDPYLKVTSGKAIHPQKRSRRKWKKTKSNNKKLSGTDQFLRSSSYHSLFHISSLLVFLSFVEISKRKRKYEVQVIFRLRHTGDGVLLSSVMSYSLF